MNGKKRQKLCQNCEGNVDFDVIFCPYCGADLLEEKEPLVAKDEESFKTLSEKESVDSLYPDHKVDIPKEAMEESYVSDHSGFSLALFLVSSWFFTLSILLFVLSENGKLHLELDATWWFTYLLIGLSTGFFAWKLLQPPKEA